MAVPIGALIAACVWLDGGGPIFYGQARLGRGLRPFRMYKFRTMRPDAETKTGPIWAVAGRDPRATRVGLVLRALHLDELPQLVNVVRGEMSLVGPRPERPEIAFRLERWVPGYLARNEARPGITGLAQIRSGYDTSLRSVRRKLRYDRIYIRRATTLFDLAILAATPLCVIRECRAPRPAPTSPRTAGAAPTQASQTPLPLVAEPSFPLRSASAHLATGSDS